MQQGYFDRHFGPKYIYIKYRCSKCKKLGEHFVKQTDWERGILHEVANELESGEKKRFQKMGPITMDEIIHFHYELDNIDLNKLPGYKKEK